MAFVAEDNGPLDKLIVRNGIFCIAVPAVSFLLSKSLLVALVLFAVTLPLCILKIRITRKRVSYDDIGITIERYSGLVDSVPWQNVTKVSDHISPDNNQTRYVIWFVLDNGRRGVVSTEMLHFYQLAKSKMHSSSPPAIQ